MNSGDIYTISFGGYTPTGKWNENNPKSYKHAAAVAAKMIRESDNDQFVRLWSEMTIWGGSLEIVTVFEGKVSVDRELEPVEGPYIAASIRNALGEREQRYVAETGQTPLLASLATRR